MGKNVRGFWTEDRKTLLKSLWERDAAPAAIAEQVGTTAAAVACKASAMKLKPRTTFRGNWSPDRIAELKELDAKGLSISQIARQMGVSRNVIAGARHRLGLSRPEKSPIKRAPGRQRDGHKTAVLPMVEVPTRLSAASGPGAGVGMADLLAGQCRWPLWENGEAATFRCCGADVEPGRPYCSEHAARAYSTANVSQAKDLDRLGKVLA